MADTLQLLAVSCELGISRLQALVKDEIRRQIRGDNVSHVQRYAERLKDADLATMCEECRKPKQRQSYQSPPVSSAILRNAVNTSIEDVTQALQGIGQVEIRDDFSASRMKSSSSAVAEDYIYSEKDLIAIDRRGSELSEDEYSHQGNKPYLKPRSGGIYSLLLKAQGAGTTTAQEQQGLWLDERLGWDCTYLYRSFINC